MPSTAKRLTGRNIYVDASFDALATNPPTNHIHVTCRGAIGSWIDHWGPIVIEKPDINVFDILNAIYEYFQTLLTFEDVDRAIALDSQNMVALTDAFGARLQATHNLYEFEAQNGLRRVDFLGNNRMFSGLTVSLFRDRDFSLRWKLVLEFLPRSGL